MGRRVCQTVVPDCRTWLRSTTSPRCRSTSASLAPAAARMRARGHRASRWSSPTPACAPPACSTARRRARRPAARGVRRDAVEPDRGRGRGRGRRPTAERLRRPGRGRRRLEHRPGQGRRDRRDPRRPAEDLRHDRRRQPEDQRAGRAADRRADHRRHRQRGGARRDRHRRRWPQARLPQLAPGAQGRAARPRADARPAAVPDRRDRHGRDRALHGNLHGAGRQSAGRRHRARRPGARLARTSSARPGTAATARRAGT